jgi:hypothetical protein
MKEDTVTVKLNGALCSRIEEFLQEHPEHGNLEEFVTGAGRILKERLAATLPRGQATGPQTRDEDYSHDNVHAAWDALNKTEPPVTSEEKTQILKDLAAGYRRLKSNLGAADRGGIQ